MFSVCVIQAVAALKEEEHYQALCRAAKENGQEPPERIKVVYEAPKKDPVPWWYLAAAILIGASIGG